MSPPVSPYAKRQKLDVGAPNDQLQKLKSMTSVVADTGDIAKIKLFKPEDATTNPTLLLQAAQMKEYGSLVEAAIQKAKSAVKSADTEQLVDEICDQLAVSFGCEILKVIPGYVSTEINADLSFDTKASLAKARKIIKMYEVEGHSKNRILIKLGSTWECIRACEVLEKEGIRCNMTLVFAFSQAVACAEAGATLISPFVGRIFDWHTKANPGTDYVSDPEKDPGVISVKKIYQYYRTYGYETIVMGASFRNKGEILALAGCDKLTIGPKLLEELEKSTEEMVRKLTPTRGSPKVKPANLDERAFRWQLNEDPMATEKLAEGLRNFNKDFLLLKDLIRQRV